MLKNIIASGVAGVLAVSSVAASAAPVAFDSANRTATSVGDAEEIGGEGSEVWLVAVFAALAAAIIFLIEDSEDDIDDLPASP